MPHDLSQAHTLIAHEWLFGPMGAERTLAEMLRVLPAAEVLVCLKSKAPSEPREVWSRARETAVRLVPGARRHYQWMLPLQAAAFGAADTSRFDLVISSSHAFAKAAHAGAWGIHLCYCHSPPRYLWDLHDTYMAGASPQRKIAMRIGLGLLRSIDRRAARGVTHFLANSQHVAARIHRAYGRVARVVYPPVAPKPLAGIAPRSRDLFLLYLGRLVRYKRVDLMVQAAQRLGIRAVIAGDGPERQGLERMARGSSLVEFRGRVTESEAATLLESCAAFIFCAEEDFGIAPLEANAHGAPVVALGRGAALETLPATAAVLFPEPTVEALEAATRSALSRSWDSTALKANAERFSAAQFRASFRDALESALAGAVW